MNFRIATLSLIIIGFAAHGEEILQWSQENQFKDWTPAYNLRMLKSEDGIMILNITGEDSRISNDKVQIITSQYNRFYLEYRTSSFPRKTSGQLYFLDASSQSFSETKRFRLPSLVSDGEWRIISLDLDRSVAWQSAMGKVSCLRLDLVDQSPGIIEIRKMGFSYEKE